MTTSEVNLSPPPLWRWATEDGEPQEGTEEELVRQLANGKVPPFALVWREGWGEWLPAMQVEELAVAFPRVAALRKARPSSIPGNIPPVPVSEYPRLRLLAKETPLGVPSELDCPEREVITSEVPVAALLEAARAMTQPSPPADLGLEVAVQRKLDSDRPPPSSRGVPLAAELGLQDLLETATSRPVKSRSWLRSQSVWVALGAVILGLSALFTIRWVGAQRAARALPPSGAAALMPEPPAPARDALASDTAPACSLAAEPVKLDNWAVVDVRPSLATALGRPYALLGYAQSHKHATGGRLDAATLDFQRTFGQQHERQIFSVTPLVAGNGASYHVERMGALVAFGRALDTVPPLRIGMNDDGLVLGPLDRRSTKAWELPVGTMISVPEVAAHDGGFTLAFRAGRVTGHLRLGVLDVSGKPLGELQQIGSPESEYGRPAIASGPRQTVLAVTSRRSPEGPFDLLLGRAPNGQLPLELAPIALPDIEGVDATAPSLAALPDGGFAVMWTEGQGWRRQVRLSRLSETLLPVGAPVDVSTPDPALGGAVAGALYWVSDRLLALYFSRRDEGHSLWAVSLACGAGAP